MQFQVPQFIDIEDKIIGPLTLKQFFYIAGAGAILFVSFFMLRTWLWIAISLPIVGLAIVLAFVRYNGRSMIVMLGAMLKYTWRPKLYLWTRGEEKKALPKIEIRAIGVQSKNPLKKLLLRLNTSRQAVPGREKNDPEVTQSASKTSSKKIEGTVSTKNAF